MQCELIETKCRIWLLETKKMKNIQQLTERGNSGTHHDKHNRVFRIKNEMKLIFVFVYCNDAMFAGNINDCMIICNNGVI